MAVAQGSVPAAGSRTRKGGGRRELLGRSAGLLFLAGAALSVAANQLLPGRGGAVVGNGAALSLLVGVACLTVPWRRMSDAWLHLVPPLAVAEVVLTVEALGAHGHVYLWNLLITAVFTGCAFRARPAVVAHTGVVAVGFVSTVLIGPVAPEDVARTVVAVPALIGAAGVVAWLREGLEASDRRHVIEARTDALTGLGNRRALMEALKRAVLPGAPRSTFVVFDLDGFKAYNDRFGHPAGDAMLERMGTRLAEAVGPRGAAFRLGGDELCVLLDLREDLARGAVRDCLAALRESGPKFDITASHGVAALPSEAATPTAALSTADARMYEVKQRRRGGTSANALLAGALRAPGAASPPRPGPRPATSPPP